MGQSTLQRNPEKNSVSNVERWRTSLVAIAIAVFVGAFHFLFLREKVWASAPTDADMRLERWQLFLVDGLFEPLANLVQRSLAPEFLLERWPSFTVAALVWSMAIVVGGGVVRILCPPSLLTRLESVTLSAGLGMAAVSIAVQLLGLAGLLDRTVIVIASAGVIIAGALIRIRHGPQHFRAIEPSTTTWMDRSIVLAGGAGVLGLAFLAASLPTPDYDAHAYHLLGPKEYFQQGSIERLPHNVYTTFPFLTEMFHLLGMVILGDWFAGGLAGQTTLAVFGVLGTASIGMLATRLYGSPAGWWAAGIYSTLPWTYRLMSIPYVEGAMLAYLALGLWALSVRELKPSTSALIAGLCAGAAFGCKYTGLVMVAVPLAVVVLGRNFGRSAISTILVYSLGFALFAGPWLARNWLWTGNPVYPLAYEWFGGEGWSAEKDARFRGAHESRDFQWGTMGAYARDILTRSDWQGSLVFSMAPLAFLAPNRRWTIVLWTFITYMFLVFFFGTHRLDRFFLTIEPLGCVLAGAGFVVFRDWCGRWLGWTLAIVVFAGSIVFCSTSLCGMNQYTLSVREAREVALSQVSESLSLLSRSGLVSDQDTVLFVGLASIYESTFGAIYNTVFDDNVLETLASGADSGLRDPGEIHREFQQRGIDFVFVDWTWIHRYREPGNYGYTDFVEPEVFQSLVHDGVLQAGVLIGGDPRYVLYRVVPQGGGS